MGEKMKFTLLNLTVLFILISSCTAPTEQPPTLEELLYGTYSKAFVSWSANSSGAHYGAETTDSTYFKLSSDGKYTMNLEIYVFNEDTVFNIYQDGTYNTIGARYVESSDFGTLSSWKGTLKFVPENQPIWEVEFSISKSSPILYFNNDNQYLFELPNSGGFIWLPYWKR